MQKRAPTLANILVIALFVLSCFGLLLYLWESFGGPLALKPKGYQFRITFPEVLQLAEQADVRISGVTVGHVVTFQKDKQDRTEATIQMNSSYAPVRANVHAILREKSLVGETFLQLIPDGNKGPFIPDNGHLADGNVEPSVTLDDILSLFTPKVRRDFQVWQQSAAASFDGRGEQINADFASLQPFVSSTNKLLSIFATQEGALRAVVNKTGVVFNALAGRDHELEGLIVNGEHTFKAAASASEAFAATWRAFPAFESKSRVAFKELDNFAADASPFFKEFQPVERQLGPTSRTLNTFSPQFEKLLVGLGGLTKASKKGLPAFSKALKLLEPVLGNLPPVLHNFNPFLQYLGQYQSELQSFFGNFTAATEGHDQNANDPAAGVPLLHYIRTMQVISPESLSVFNERIGTDRANAYPLSGAFNTLGSGLSVFSNSSCANTSPSVNGPANATVAQGVIEQLIETHVANTPTTPNGIFSEEGTPAEAKARKETREGAEAAKAAGGGNAVPAPACTQQGPNSFNGQSSQFPHVASSGK